MHGDAATLYADATAGDMTVTLGEDILIDQTSTEVMVDDADASIQIIPGADTFVFTGRFGDDEIRDFNVGLDTVRFEDYRDMTFDDLTFGYEKGEYSGLVLYLDDDNGGGQIHFWALDSLSESDVVFV